MKTLLASICASILALSNPASASVISFHADLSGAQEVPPSGSPGIGTATLTADTVAEVFHLNEAFSGLLGTTIVAHLHTGAPGLTGRVIIPFSYFPVGVTSGNYSTIFTADNLVNELATGISTFADLLGALEAGNTYLNIHSDLFAAGEIRGQVTPAIPEPMTLALLGVGLIGLAGVRRWRA